MNTKFFRNYPRINYIVDNDGSTTLLTDITRAVVVNSLTVADDASNYILYDINDGDRPDIISHKLYGDVQYYWTFFIINDQLKNGYNHGWPLSYNDFSRMLEKEYSKYSAISFLPTGNLNEQSNTDFSLVPLNDQYLPYLRLASLDDSVHAKILKYDTALHQCVIYDIVDSRTKNSISREYFVKYRIIDRDNPLLGKTDFKVVWDDSVMISESSDDSDIIMTNRNAKLKLEWLNIAFSNFVSVDPSGLNDINFLESNTELTSEQIEQRMQQLKNDYVLNKKILATSNFFRWNNYEDAARYYTINSKVITAYDVLSNENTIFHEYTSNLMYESEINDSKRQIRVINPKFIRQFSEEYYEILNS
jgi:hypothetical protein